MEALVYEDTPLADYYEGQAIPADISGRTTPEPHHSFAPKGLPGISSSLRSVANTATFQRQTSEQILERFRYIIVASQLLADEALPRTVEKTQDGADTNLLQGAIISATLAFTAAWTLQWLRERWQNVTTLTWTELGVYCLAGLAIIIVLAYFGRRHYSRSIQRKAATSLTRLVNDSHAFDTTVGRTIRFVQEVELVARGYDIRSSLLSPISRIEDKASTRRCQRLRSELIDTLTILTTLYVEAHNTLQTFLDQQDLQRYHDIYEISLNEYSEAIRIANETTEEKRTSLKELRFAARLHTLARKVLLCDLLAIRCTRGWARVRVWHIVQRILCDLEELTSSRQHHVSVILHDEECGQYAGDPSTPVRHIEPHQPSSSLKLQQARFDDVAHSIRALNAKAHVLREEMAGLTAANTDEIVLSSSIVKHYEAIGAEIRALQYDWERGRNTMILHADTTTNTNIMSPISSHGPRTPPRSPSLAGLSIIDGGPADALRVLNGDDLKSYRSSDATLFDEEVFEAVSQPRKRLSLAAQGMSREEKIAKMNEERRKRATVQEKADTTTNMLRELQMVIKHRPSVRGRSPGENRVTSL